jgi:hypothetical protein
MLGAVSRIVTQLQELHASRPVVQHGFHSCASLRAVCVSMVLDLLPLEWIHDAHEHDAWTIACVFRVGLVT